MPHPVGQTGLILCYTRRGHSRLVRYVLPDEYVLYRQSRGDWRRGNVLRNASLGVLVVVQTCNYTNLDITV